MTETAWTVNDTDSLELWILNLEPQTLNQTRKRVQDPLFIMDWKIDYYLLEAPGPPWPPNLYICTFRIFSNSLYCSSVRSAFTPLLYFLASLFHLSAHSFEINLPHIDTGAESAHHRIHQTIVQYQHLGNLIFVQFHTFSLFLDHVLQHFSTVKIQHLCHSWYAHCQREKQNQSSFFIFHF